MRKLAWASKAWKDYLYWQSQDKKTVKRINRLIQETLSNPFEGIGKPEPLRENLSNTARLRIFSLSSREQGDRSREKKEINAFLITKVQDY